MTQSTALKILQTGANVFLTGEPGSGKTHIVNQYVAWLRERGVEPAITASTGIAATHIGGMTIHSWSGIGVRRNLSPYDLDTIASNPRVVKRVSRASVLIIDEVSMLSADTLAMAEAVCREVRRSHAPFGGLRVLLVGDFFQLPPIVPNEREENGALRRIQPAHREQVQGRPVRLGFGEDASNETPAPFAFRSAAWSALDPVVCYLSEQHRQEDAVFLDLLSRVRFGKTDARAHELLATRRTNEQQAPKELPRLFCHNVDVDRVNEERLSAIPGKARQFRMTAAGPDVLIAALKRGCLSPETLSLKTGARVIFTKNKPDGSFVNGTLGEVEGFADGGTPVVRAFSGRRIVAEPMEWTISDGSHVLAKIEQVPMRLAWAITVHKSQGMTLDAAVVDLSDAFEYGQGYVALSRVRALAGLHLLGLNDRALEVHPEVSAADRDFKLRSARARTVFEPMPDAEHRMLARNFVRVSGGEPDGSITAKTKTKKTKAPGPALNLPAVSLLNPSKGSTLDATLALLQNHKTIQEIARARGLARSTIFSHVYELHAAGRIGSAEVERIAPAHLKKALPNIHTVFRQLGAERLTPVFEKLRGAYSYADLRIARMLMK